MKRKLKPERLPRKLFALYCRANHARKIRELRKRRGKIRVGFLVSSLASWKSQELAEAMQNDDDFEVIVYLCPVVNGTLAAVQDEELDKLRRVFAETTLETCDLSVVGQHGARARLERDGVDLYFFTNPHNLSWSELYAPLFSSKLSVYLPYSHEVSQYDGNAQQYNQPFHNAMWRIYVAHEDSRQIFRDVRAIGDRNVVVSGYPCCEPLWAAQGAPRISDDSRKTVIWAPHWIMSDDLKWATVYELGDDLMSLAEEFRDDVRWIVRPHPFLAPHMSSLEDWGPERTSAFFEFWENSEFSRIESGDYVDSFVQSDAMIHDSGSFLAEYLYLDRPVMYLRTEATSAEGLNAFGQRARSACQIGRSRDDIRAFLVDIVDGRDPGATDRRTFIDREFAPLMQRSPSQVILDDIRAALRET